MCSAAFDPEGRFEVVVVDFLGGFAAAAIEAGVSDAMAAVRLCFFSDQSWQERAQSASGEKPIDDLTPEQGRRCSRWSDGFPCHFRNEDDVKMGSLLFGLCIQLGKTLTNLPAPAASSSLRASSPAALLEIAAGRSGLWRHYRRVKNAGLKSLGSVDNGFCQRRWVPTIFHIFSSPVGKWRKKAVRAFSSDLPASPDVFVHNCLH